MLIIAIVMIMMTSMALEIHHFQYFRPPTVKVSWLCSFHFGANNSQKDGKGPQSPFSSKSFSSVLNQKSFQIITEVNQIDHFIIH